MAGAEVGGGGCSRNGEALSHPRAAGELGAWDWKGHKEETAPPPHTHTQHSPSGSLRSLCLQVARLCMSYPLPTRGEAPNTGFFIRSLRTASWGGAEPGRCQDAHGSPLCPVWNWTPLGQVDVLPWRIGSLQCWSWVVFGPLRSHALPCPGGVDRVAWKSGSATGKSLQVGPSARRDRPGSNKAMSSAGDREPTVMTHLLSVPAQKPFLRRQRGIRRGQELGSHPGSGPGLQV